MWLIPLVVTLNAPVFGAEPPCDQAAAGAKTKEAEQAKTPASRADLARQAIVACPSHAEAHNALGTALEEMGDLDGARAEYQKASDLAPAWYLPLMGLGDLARREGDTKAAEGHYLRATALARNAAEREEATLAAAEVRQPGGGYAFKSADSITRALKLSEDAKPSPTRTFGAAEEVGGDFYESSQGPAVNLSIVFKVSSADLTGQGMKQLDELGKAVASARQSIRFRIEGFASSEGRPEVNLALSNARALSVQGYLVRRYNIDRARLEAIGRGSESPVIEHGHENREKSRRVTMIRLYDR